jgi:hypothetical protein
MSKPQKTRLDQFCQFEIGENLIRKVYRDLIYDLDGATITELKPLVTQVAHIPNTTKDPITKTLTFTYEKSEEGTWQNEVGVMVDSRRRSIPASLP